MVKLTTGEKIARDLCEMDATIGNAIEVDPVDVARRIDEAMLELSQQLAAEQLNNKLLRDALQSYIDEHEECQDADDWMVMMCSMEAHHAANEALSIPASTEALDKYVAEKVKEATATQKEYYEGVFQDGSKQIAKAFRQRDLAVEALKSCGVNDGLNGPTQYFDEDLVERAIKESDWK